MFKENQEVFRLDIHLHSEYFQKSNLVLGIFLILKALLHGAINCSYNCNWIAATFECAITHRQSL